MNRLGCFTKFDATLIEVNYMDIAAIEQEIEQIWDNTETYSADDAAHLIDKALTLLTQGKIRAASKPQGSDWVVHEWVKKAVLLHFRYNEMRPMEAGALHFYDKVTVRSDWVGTGVRVVPPATVRNGAFVNRGAVLMPSYINIGAYVDEKTMIDTWSTVGSCAQIGKHCHISGGVGIGGVLEPLQATPVIIEDNCFIGARSEVAEGVIVREGAVLAMGCYVGKSTKIYDATDGGKILHGEIPSRAVVVPGSIPAPDGSHSTYALIIKKYRDAQTDAKTALNEILR